MGAPIGNTNGCGKKGKSGRKSQTDERATYETLVEVWVKKHKKREIDAKIASGHYTMMDMLIKLALDGNDKILLAIFDKVFPDGAMRWQSDQYHHYGKVQADELTPEEKAKLADLVERAFEGGDEKEDASNLRVTVEQLLATHR